MAHDEVVARHRPIVVDCLVSALLAFIVCLLLTIVLRMLPFRKYIVGR